ncbi:MAG: alpha/beta fold hydrolase [Acidobacteriota bacterium]
MIAILSVLLTLVFGCRQGSELAAEEVSGLQNGEFTAELNGTNIFYAVHGSGPVLMALPNSWGLTHEGLRVMFGPLEEHLTMVYFDPRGMGRSAAIVSEDDMSMATIRADLDALRLHLGLGKVNVIGWSNGGFNLFLLAANYPESVSSAIVLHSAANLSQEDLDLMKENHSELFQKFKAFQAEMTQGKFPEEEQNARMKDFVINEWFPYLFADPEAGKEMLKTFYEGVGFSWRHSAYANTVDTQNFDVRAALPRISCPTLIIAGAHDMMAPARVEEAHKAIAGSRFILFERSAHFAPVEEQEKFVRAILDFIKGSGS